MLLPEQKEGLKGVFGPKQKLLGELDFVACWYAKASDLIQGTSTRCAFVSTNSITQGEQVAPLWKRLNVEIDFAYRMFKWHNEAKGNAAVHCVIIGFHAKREFNSDAGKVLRLTPPLSSTSSAPLNERVCSLGGGVSPTPPETGYGAEPHFRKQSQEPMSLGQGREASGGVSRSHLPPSELKQKTKTIFDSDGRAIPAHHINGYLLDAPDVIIESRSATLYHFGVLTSAMHNAWLRVVGGRLKSDYRYSKDLVYNTSVWPEVRGDEGEMGVGGAGGALSTVTHSTHSTSSTYSTISAAAQSILDARALYPMASLAELYDPLVMPAGAGEGARAA